MKIGELHEPDPELGKQEEGDKTCRYYRKNGILFRKGQTPEKDQSSKEETLLVVESDDSVNEENIAEWRNENISSKLKMGNQLDRKQHEFINY